MPRSVLACDKMAPMRTRPSDRSTHTSVVCAVRALLLAIVGFAIVPQAVSPAPRAVAAGTNVLVIEGRGFGHGLGMSQDGAYWLARNGWNVDKILKLFYPGTALASRGGTVRVTIGGSGTHLLSFPGGGRVNDLRVGPGTAVRVVRVGAGYRGELAGRDLGDVRRTARVVRRSVSGRVSRPFRSIGFVARPLMQIPPGDTPTTQSTPPTQSTPTTPTPSTPQSTPTPTTPPVTAAPPDATTAPTPAPPDPAGQVSPDPAPDGSDGSLASVPGPAPISVPAPADTAPSGPPPSGPPTHDPNAPSVSPQDGSAGAQPTTEPEPAAEPAIEPAAESDPTASTRPGSEPAATLRASPDPGSVIVLADGRKFRGTLEISGQGVVNDIDVEQYLRGMGEIRSREWPAASLQAQAIAARTYALRAMAIDGRICPTERCQVYVGAHFEYPEMDAAVSATSGKVLTYKGSLAATFYSASDGGYSATPQEAFGPGSPDVPYLVATPHIAGDVRPWEVRVSLDEVGRRVGYGSRVRDVTITKVGPSGRALEVTVHGESGSRVVSGVAFDRALGLRSTLFRLRREVSSAPVPTLPDAPEDVLSAQASLLNQPSSLAAAEALSVPDATALETDETDTFIATASSTMATSSPAATPTPTNEVDSTLRATAGRSSDSGLSPTEEASSAEQAGARQGGGLAPLDLAVAVGVVVMLGGGVTIALRRRT